ncbi:MAG: hypothetical protein CMP20_04080 [Rickettsiales bacterium]|nr:hypothetical protein [Rickettsiales bacterium]
MTDINNSVTWEREIADATKSVRAAISVYTSLDNAHKENQHRHNYRAFPSEILQEMFDQSGIDGLTDADFDGSGAKVSDAKLHALVAVHQWRRDNQMRTHGLAQVFSGPKNPPRPVVAEQPPYNPAERFFERLLSSKVGGLPKHTNIDAQAEVDQILRKCYGDGMLETIAAADELAETLKHVMPHSGHEEHGTAKAKVEAYEKAKTMISDELDREVKAAMARGPMFL